jgi:hypothetical protein
MHTYCELSKYLAENPPNLSVEKIRKLFIMYAILAMRALREELSIAYTSVLYSGVHSVDFLQGVSPYCCRLKVFVTYS